MEHDEWRQRRRHTLLRGWHCDHGARVDPPAATILRAETVPPYGGDTTWYNTVARELQAEGVEVVYLLTSPVDYIRFAQQADQQGFRPQYVGVGITMGLNPVLESGCPHVDGGQFFSPFPGLDFARDNVPEFFQAADRFGVPADDIAFAIWGQARATHEIFQQYEEVYGADLTREDYRDLVRSSDFSGGGVFPPTSFSEADPFGAGQVHVLQADCGAGEHVTVQSFVDDF
jgi:ABC-type branched-subunit amino acid transport system substrate-binding protein